MLHPGSALCLWQSSRRSGVSLVVHVGAEVPVLGKGSEWIHYLRAILTVFTTLGALVLSTREMFTLL